MDFDALRAELKAATADEEAAASALAAAQIAHIQAFERSTLAESAILDYLSSTDVISDPVQPAPKVDEPIVTP